MVEGCSAGASVTDGSSNGASEVVAAGDVVGTGATTGGASEVGEAEVSSVVGGCSTVAAPVSVGLAGTSVLEGSTTGAEVGVGTTAAGIRCQNQEDIRVPVIKLTAIGAIIRGHSRQRQREETRQLIDQAARAGSYGTLGRGRRGCGRRCCCLINSWSVCRYD